MTRSDSSWLHRLCPVCGEEASLEDEVIVDHNNLDGAACIASGRRAKTPNYPVSVLYVCDLCGQRTKSNLKTGVVHSHNLHGTVAVCANSGKFIGPVGQIVELELLPPKPLEPTQSGRKVVSKGYSDRPSTSVRTISGGLPSLGKHH